ncbi:uncharacterized protein LOC106460807 isoform X3 [Limulus polyphemus]|uniref:Uncharacterized protein LOC106460807 isoform X3 n=1 Tax=Limulus polyphemus TaxID=6850 RepID=A0ABM1SI54_LIMPO|nr:uncharacterized protein LOC106460807 isoform X3 [Limulus polyphemus]
MESRPDFSLDRSRLLAGAGLNTPHGFPVDAPSPHPTPLRTSFSDMSRAGTANDPSSLSAYHSRFLQASLPLGNNGTSYSYLSGIYNSNFPAPSTSPFRVPPTGIIMRQFWPPTPPPDNYSRYGIGSSLYTMFPAMGSLAPSTDPNPYSSQGYISRLGQSSSHYHSILEAAHKEPTYLPPGLALASPLAMNSHLGHTTPVPSLTPALDRHPSYSHLGLGMKGLDVGRRTLLVEEEDFRRVERGADDLEGFLKREVSNVSCHHKVDRARLGMNVIESQIRAAGKQTDSSSSVVSQEKASESRSKNREDKQKDKKMQLHLTECCLTHNNPLLCRGTKHSKSRGLTTSYEVEKTAKEKKCSRCSSDLTNSIGSPHCVTKTTAKVKSTDYQEEHQKTVLDSSLTTTVVTPTSTVETTSVTTTRIHMTPSLVNSNVSIISKTQKSNNTVSVDDTKISNKTSQCKEKCRDSSISCSTQSDLAPQSQNLTCSDHDHDILKLTQSQEAGTIDLSLPLTGQSCEPIRNVSSQVSEGENEQSLLSSQNTSISKVSESLISKQKSSNTLSRSCSLTLSHTVASQPLKDDNSTLCVVSSNSKRHLTHSPKSHTPSSTPMLLSGVHIKQERIEGEEHCPLSKTCNSSLSSTWQDLSLSRNDMTEEDQGVINLSIPRRVPKQEPVEFALHYRMQPESPSRKSLSSEKVQSDFVSSKNLATLTGLALHGTTSVAKSTLQTNDVMHPTDQIAEKPRSSGKAVKATTSVQSQLVSNPDCASTFSLVTTCLTVSQPPVLSSTLSGLPSQDGGISGQQTFPASKRSDYPFVATNANPHPSTTTKPSASVSGSLTWSCSSGNSVSTNNTCQPSSVALTFSSTANSNIPVGIAVAQKRQGVSTNSADKGGSQFGINTDHSSRSSAISSLPTGSSDSSIPEKEGYLQESSGLNMQQHPVEPNLNDNSTCILSQDVNPPVTQWESDSVVRTPIAQHWVTPSPVVGPTVWLSQNTYNPTPAPPQTALPYSIDPSHIPISPGGYQVYRDSLTNQIFLLPTATNIEIVDRSGIWTGYPAPPCSTPVQQMFTTQPHQPPFQAQAIQEEDQLKHQTTKNKNSSLPSNCITTLEISEDEERNGSSQGICEEYEDDKTEDKTHGMLHTAPSLPLGSSSTVSYPAFPQATAPAALSYFYEASTIVHLTQTQSTTAIQTEPGKRSQGTSPMNPVTPSPPPVLLGSEQGVQTSVSDEGDESENNDEEGEIEVSQVTTEGEQPSQAMSVTTAIQVDMDSQTNSDYTDVEEHAVEVTDSANQTDNLLMSVGKEFCTSGEEESCDVTHPLSPAVIENLSVANSNDSETQLFQEQPSLNVEVVEEDSAPVLSAASKPVMDFIDHHGLNLLVDSIEEFASREQEGKTMEMDQHHSDNSDEQSSKKISDLDDSAKVNDIMNPSEDSMLLKSKSLSNSIDSSCTDGLGLLCALAEQRFLEESMNIQGPEVGLNLSLKHDINQNYEESNRQDDNPNSKSPLQVYAFSSKSSSPFYTLESPLFVSNAPKTMDVAELEMKLQLAELQKKYKEKQKELAKLQPKKEKEEPDNTPVKRRPGRPRKKRFMTLKSKTLDISPTLFGDLLSESVPETSAPVLDPSQHSSSSELTFFETLAPETSDVLSGSPKKKKKKCSPTENKICQILKKPKENRFCAKFSVTKKSNTKGKKSSLKPEFTNKTGELNGYQTEKLQTLPVPVQEDIPIDNCNTLMIDDKDISAADDNTKKYLKPKNETKISSEAVKEDYNEQEMESSVNKQGLSKSHSSEINNEDKDSTENKNNVLPTLIPSDIKITEDVNDIMNEAKESSELAVLTHINVSSTTPDRVMKRKFEQGESESNTSDAEVSSAKKRKPGRPKKHSPSKPDEVTETIVSKQPKKLAFLKAKAQAKQMKTEMNKTKTRSESESKVSCFEEDIWFRRRSERIFLHDAGVVPGAMSPWRGENVDLSSTSVKELSVNDSKKFISQPQIKYETTSKNSRSNSKSEDKSESSKKLKVKKDSELSSKKMKTKENKKQQKKEKMVPDDLFTALKKCRLSESSQGITSPHPADLENSESSEGENIPLSALIDRSSTPAFLGELRSCLLQPQELDEHLRVLTMDDGLFYAGTIKAIQAPDVYGITRDGERGNRPHIYSREEILNEAIVEVKPTSLRHLPEGRRICAFWSQQYRCMYPGTVAKSSSPKRDSDRDMVYVEFDDGDSGRISLKDICMLPPNYPVVSTDLNPLMLLGKRRQHQVSEGSITDNSATTSSHNGEKVKIKKNKNKSKSGKKKNYKSQNQNMDVYSQMGDVSYPETLLSFSGSKDSSFISTTTSYSAPFTLTTFAATTTTAVNNGKATSVYSSKKEKNKNSQKKKSKKSKGESRSKIKEKSKEKEWHHIGSSSETSCGPPSLKTKKHKKHKDDHKHRRHHHHHHCHHHHHHKKHRHEKRSNPSSPEHCMSSSCSDANTSKVVSSSSRTSLTENTASVLKDTSSSSQQLPLVEVSSESLTIEERNPSTERKKSELMLKIRTNSTDIPQEHDKEIYKEDKKDADVESSSENSSDSSESSDSSDKERTTTTLSTVNEESQQNIKKTSKSSEDSEKFSEKKRRKDRLPSVEKSKIAAQQLWRWAGKSFRRASTKGKAKKEFYKAIIRGKETIKVGDCAVFLSTGRPHLPFIGRIETMWQSWGGNMVVKVKWFYHPDETKGGNQLLEPKGAVFQSPHMDENDVQTISHKCEVLSWTEYKARRVAETSSGKSEYGSMFDNNDVYYLAGSYDPLTASLNLEAGVS